MKKLVASLLALLLAPACAAEQDQVPGPTPPPGPTQAEPVVPTATPEPTAAASATTPEPAPRLPLLQLQKAALQTMMVAFNAHDAKKLASLYAQDARVGTPGAAGWIEETGPTSVEEGHTKLFAAFPDMKWASPRVYISGPVVIQEWVSIATHKGDLGAKKPTEKPVGIYGASVYRFNEDGLITHDHTYFDATTISAQIGQQKGKARPVPTLSPGEPQIIVASGAPEEGKWANAAKALYASFAGNDEKRFLSLLAPDAARVNYSQPEDRRGEKAAREDFLALHKAFPDVQITTQNVWAFGDRVIAEVTMTGTHTGALGTIKPTKKQVKTHSLDFFKFGPDGKVVELVSYSSSAELMGQLNASDATGGAKPDAKPDTKPAPQPKKDAHQH
jgi:predicted ester cyclase